MKLQINLSKEKPEKFDECLDLKFKWYSPCLAPVNWRNVAYLGEYENYYFYFAWDNEKEDGCLYRTKITEEQKREPILKPEITTDYKIKILAEAILEQQKYEQLCPQTIEKLRELVK